MAKTLKPYEVPLDADLAREILNTPLQSAFELRAPATLGDRVNAAIQAVDEANEFLATSKLASIVADTLMRQLKKRGNASIRVRPDGMVVLHVSYEEQVKPKPKPPVKTTTRKSDLPTLDEMRATAHQLGVDIEPLGRQRRRIHALLERTKRERAADAKTKKKAAPPKRMVDETTESDVPAQLPPVPVPEGDELDMSEFMES